MRGVVVRPGPGSEPAQTIDENSTNELLLAAEVPQSPPEDQTSPAVRDPASIVVWGLGLYVMLYFAWLIFRWGGSPYETLIGDLAFIPITLTAPILAWRASTHPRLGETARSAWRLVALSFAALAVGDILWFWIEVVMGKSPSPSLADIGYLAFYPLLLWGLLSFPADFRSSRTDQMKFGLDSGTVLLGGAMLLWYFVLRPVALAEAADPLAAGLSLAYPLGDLAIVLGIIGLLLRKPKGGSSQALTTLVVGALLFVIADTGFAYMSLQDTYRTGDWPDAVWMIAQYLMVVSGWLQYRGAAGSASAEPPAGLRKTQNLLPYFAIFAGYGSVLIIAFPHWTQPLGGLALSALALTGLVILRQVVAMRESARLAGEHSALIRNSSDVIFILDARNTIRYHSPSAEKAFGYKQDELTRAELLSLVHRDDIARMLLFLAEQAKQPGAGSQLEWRVLHKNGSWLYVESTGTNLINDPNIRGIVLTTRDISERKMLEEQLSHQAFHDPLTDLANLALFRDRVEHALARSTRHSKPLAVLFLDLNEFKNVNDRLGHSAGDQLLVEMAQRILSCLRGTDTAARLGGDEFAILLEEIRDAGDATRVADRILSQAEAPFTLEGREMFVGLSIGIAINAPGEGGTGELLRNADVAMYIAKRQGSRYEVFEPGMHASALERLEIEADLRKAVDRGEFVIHYQPIVSLDTGKVAGMEALLRWDHPERGLLLPSRFLHLAEEMGLMLPIGKLMLEETCLQARKWQQRFRNQDLSMTLNISAKQLFDPELAGNVVKIIGRHRLRPDNLILEIMESDLVRDTDASAAKMRELKELGIRFSIDDFGTGYSSLSYLGQFPADILKIGKSFVDGLERGREGWALARAIIDLGRSLSLQTVAEGIELEEHAEKLRELGCEQGQGYYFARPLEVSAIDNLLAAGRLPVMKLPHSA